MTGNNKKALTKLRNLTKSVLKGLRYPVKVKGKKLNLYGAGRRLDGSPDYFRVFPRDSFTSAFLLKDSKFLRDLLVFCCLTQGKKLDPLTGEEPGKIPHEWPGVILKGRSTLYASVDSTPLFLIGFGVLWNWTKDGGFIRKNHKSIERAIEYIMRHLKDNLFWDDPAYCGAKDYVLWSGCWRDGGYPERKNREHAYPASYFMVNIFVIKALRILAHFEKLGIFPRWGKSLSQLAEQVKKEMIKSFWLSSKGYFASAIDQEGEIDTFYLDSVWPLAFFENSALPREKAESIFRNLKKLEIPFGYLSREGLPGYDYEGEKKVIEGTIWPIEHAYLALTAQKYGKPMVFEKALLPIKVLAKSKYPFAEYISFEKGKPVPRGCQLQLWTIAYISNALLKRRARLFLSLP